MSSRLLPSPKVFISAAQLKPVVENVIFFDVRSKIVDSEKCRPSHSCLFVDYNSTIVRDLEVLAKTGARHALPAIDKFVAWAESTGIGRKPVVCLDDKCGGSNAARLWWMLDNIGIEAYILDGGIYAYAEEGLPTTSGSHASFTSLDAPFAPGSAPYSSYAKKSWSNIVTIDEISTAKILLDARNPERFDSLARSFAQDGQAGHISTSLNYPYMSNMTHKESDPRARLLAESELLAQWTKMTRGVAPQEVVHCCGSGVTAAYNVAVQRHLGLPDPRLYVGSWSEWSTANREAVVKDQIAKQGYSIVFLTTNVDGPSASAVSVDGTKFENIEAFAKEFGEADSALVKAVKQLKVTEKVQIYTAVKVYDVEA